MQPEELPEGARKAYDSYQRHVGDEDIGAATLFRVPIKGKIAYAVRVRTDGDDGWLESYDERGKLLAAGRTCIELVSWGDPDTLRAQVPTGEFPPDLDPRRSPWKS